MAWGSSPGAATASTADRRCRANLSIWQSIENPRRTGARSVPLRSVTATTSRLGPFLHDLACLTAAAWDKPRSARQELTGARPCRRGNFVVGLDRCFGIFGWPEDVLTTTAYACRNKSP